MVKNQTGISFVLHSNSKGKTMKKKTFTWDKFGYIIFKICNIVFMIMFCIITLYPVLNTVALSFNDGKDAVEGGVYLFPRVFTFENYRYVLSRQGIVTAVIVTFARTIIGTCLSLLANALLAFIVSRKKFLFKSQLSLFWILTMYISGGMVPTLLLYKKLGLTGTFAVYIVPGLIGAFNMLVIRTFMRGIPDSLEESARLDGAGYFTIFWRIISPLCVPLYAVIALFVGVGHWYSWFDVMLYNRMNEEYTTLQYEILKYLSAVQFQSGNAARDWHEPLVLRAALTVLTMFPVIVIYPLLQRYFVTGLTIGGVKE